MGAVVALCALRVRREDPDRGAWLALTLALACWTIGNTYLKRLPVDELDAAIVRTAVDLGRRLGISVAAEGVEDADTLRRLPSTAR